MGAKIIGFLATLMLSIPLAAIGLMAVFGIPQLVPANGDSANPRDKVIRGVREALNWAQSSSDEKNTEKTAEFDDAPRFGGASSFSGEENFQRQQAEERVAANATSSRIFDIPPQRNLDASPSAPAQKTAAITPNSPRHWSEIPAWGTDRTRPAASSTSSSREFSSQSGPGVSTTPFAAESSSEMEPHVPLMTWRQASLRLAELGVKNYHLERGNTEGTFLFVCTFSPGDAPHIVHRFEAQTDDPLLAVNQVLQQVDRWMRSRYAANNFPSRPQSMSMPPDSRL